MATYEKSSYRTVITNHRPASSGRILSSSSRNLIALSPETNTDGDERPLQSFTVSQDMRSSTQSSGGNLRLQADGGKNQPPSAGTRGPSGGNNRGAASPSPLQRRLSAPIKRTDNYTGEDSPTRFAPTSLSLPGSRRPSVMRVGSADLRDEDKPRPSSSGGGGMIPVLMRKSSKVAFDGGDGRKQKA